MISFKFEQHQMTKFRDAAAGFLTAMILGTNSPEAWSQDRRLVVAVGSYMATVYFHEWLMQDGCKGTQPLWNPNSTKNEKWILRAVDPQDKAELSKNMHRMRSLFEESGRTVYDEILEISKKAPSREAGCAYLNGYLSGIAFRPEMELLAGELKNYGSVTPRRDR